MKLETTIDQTLILRVAADPNSASFRRLQVGAGPVSHRTDTRRGPATARQEQGHDAPYVTIVLPCYNEAGARDRRGRADQRGHGRERATTTSCSRSTTPRPTTPWPGCTRRRRASRRWRSCPSAATAAPASCGASAPSGARGEIVVWTDADMTYPNERIPELVALLEKDPTIDQVVGARTSEQGTYKLLRVPAKWLIRKFAERLDQNHDPGPELGSAGLPARGVAALPAAAAARVLLRHHHHRGVPREPARASLRRRSSTPSAPGRSKFKFVTDAYRYILQVLRMTMYFNPLKVLMPLALFLLGSASSRASTTYRRTR